ncbi:MAG TPA: site-specific integrase [Desulfitobacteriaceae bacterium]|nr:site-specific integrase [Desulfitobacteriaceae bacterium]
MASVKSLDNGKFKVTISAGFDGNGNRKRIYETIEAKSGPAAQKRANALEAEVRKGEYIEPSKLTFAEYIAEWDRDAQRKLSPKTYFRYNELLKGRIIPHLGNVKLEKLNPVLIESFYNEIRKPQKREKTEKDGTKKVTTYTLSETTLRHYHRLISTIMQTAFKKGIIKENPCSRVDAPRAKKKELPIYNEEQISTLIAALEGAELKFKTCVHIALAGGLRLGEITGLEWPDVDFNNHTITIRRTSQYLPGRDLITKDPKNETSKRTIVLPSQVMDLINQLEHSQKILQLKLGNKWQGRDFKNEKGSQKEKTPGRLFTQADGSTMYPHTPSKWFHKFLEKNNLPPLPFHGLRHTSASYLIAAGQDVVTVAKRLGHSNSNTTLAIYAHSFKKRDEETATRMEGMYASKKEENVAK